MNLFVVVRMGVYDRGIVGVYDNKIDAINGFIEAKNYEKDDYHNFEIRTYELNKTIDFNSSDIDDTSGNWSEPYYDDDNCTKLKENKNDRA